MYNDTDERRRYEPGSRRSRHQEPEGHGEQYAEDPYADEHAAYAEDDAGSGHYQAEHDHEPVYDEAAPRRSRLIPILSIVAAVLVVVIGVGAALYFLGVFGGSDRPVATATSGEDAGIPDAPGADGTGDVRTVGPSIAPDTAAAEPGTETNPSVPDAVVSIAPPAQGEPPVRSVHDAWQVRCDTPAGAQSEQCVLMQFVTAEDRENVGLTVIVLKTADQKARIMRILAPLGVLLPSGLGLKIDDADIGRAGFVRCLPNGCVAEVILEDQLLGQLEKGKTATFIIFQTPEEGIGIPISLAGFGEGFSDLP